MLELAHPDSLQALNEYLIVIDTIHSYKNAVQEGITFPTMPGLF